MLADWQTFTGKLGIKSHFMNYKGQSLVWTNILGLVGLHAAALWFLTSQLLSVSLYTIFFGLAFVTVGLLGVTGGAHRLWAHNSYKAKLPYELLILLFFTITCQVSVFDWVRTHRTHHRFSDTDADPHNATRGLFFSHFGWLMVRKHPEVKEKGRLIDMSDIEANPLLTFQRKYILPLKIIFAFIIPICVPALLWGESWKNSILGMALFHSIILNSSYSINSVAHLIGTRPYLARMKPVENKLISVVSFGEGWHNYHHTFPWDYKARELGPDSLELTTKLIELAAWLGLCYDLKEPSQELIRRVALRHGDGSWQQSSCPPSANYLLH